MKGSKSLVKAAGLLVKEAIQNARIVNVNYFLILFA